MVMLDEARGVGRGTILRTHTAGTAGACPKQGRSFVPGNGRNLILHGRTSTALRIPAGSPRWTSDVVSLVLCYGLGLSS